MSAQVAEPKARNTGRSHPTKRATSSRSRAKAGATLVGRIEGVDISDFWLLSLHFSPNGYDKLSFLDSNSIAPEPSTVFLIVIGTILLSLWRTRGLKIL